MMKPQRHMLAAMAAAAVVLTSGCVKLWHKNIDIKTYMIQAERKGPALETATPGKLWIDEVTVLPPYNVRNMVTRISEVEFAASFYTELLLPPAENFRNSFYAWFAASGLFEQVGIADRIGMTHRLTATVAKFYCDSENRQAVLNIKVTLLDEKTKGVRVLLGKDYEQRIDVSEMSADELMRAYNQGLATILADCETDVNEALRPR